PKQYLRHLVSDASVTLDFVTSATNHLVHVMTTRTGSSTGLVSRGPTKADGDFALGAVAVDVVISSESTTEETIDDVTYTVHDPATVDHEWQLTATPMTEGIFDQGLSYESLDTDIATVDS